MAVTADDLRDDGTLPDSPAPPPSSDSQAAHTGVTANRGGAGTHLGPAERREIAIAFLTDRQGRSVSALSRQFGRTREAIAGCLKGEDFERIRSEVNASAVKSARARLDEAVEEAADSWVDTLAVAARKGDHRPAKELLLHTRVIEPIDDGNSGPRVIVQIGVQDGDVKLTP